MSESAASVAYVGRFAPSPTGPLHMGSLVAAMASYLDARAHQGKWLVRIEDLDTERNVPGAAEAMLQTLQRCGMQLDGDVVWQSQRTHLYDAALQSLAPYVYPCGCSRKEIADSHMRLGEAANQVYPGTCRNGLAEGRVPRSWRLRVPVPPEVIRFHDRAAGELIQNLTQEVGDFVLKRADGFWAYQLAVVVDDAAQGVTHIVRGADLLDSSARQIYLQKLLGAPQPSYLHVPVVNNASGDKLSKQTGATAFDTGRTELELLQTALLPAARFLNLDVPQSESLDAFWKSATSAWRSRFAE